MFHCIHFTVYVDYVCLVFHGFSKCITLWLYHVVCLTHKSLGLILNGNVLWVYKLFYCLVAPYHLLSLVVLISCRWRLVSCLIPVALCSSIISTRWSLLSIRYNNVHFLWFFKLFYGLAAPYCRFTFLALIFLIRVVPTFGRFII